MASGSVSMRRALLAGTSLMALALLPPPALAGPGQTIANQTVATVTNPAGQSVTSIVITGSTVTGAVANAGTISPGKAVFVVTGLLVNTGMIGGGIANTGTINVSSAGSVFGIFILGSTVSGGITNSGTITAKITANSGFARANGIEVADSTISGGVGDDLASDWFLALWQLVPTPAKAVRAREGAIRRLLEAHRIRRFDAAEALRILRDKPLTVAPGTTEAARAHLRALAERIGLVNKQLRKARHQLDQLCAELEASAEDPSGQNCEQRDVAILRSLPGVGRIILATLLAEGSEPLGRRDYHVLRTLSGVAPVTRRSGKTCLVILSLPRGASTPSIIGRASPATAIQQARKSATPCFASAAIVMAGRYGPSVTACSSWPALYSAAKSCSTGTTRVSWPQPLTERQGPIPGFDRGAYPFVPDLPPAERRAQRKSPRRGRSEAEHRACAVDGASTALQSSSTGGPNTSTTAGLPPRHFGLAKW